jgi:hypothetical protein
MKIQSLHSLKSHSRDHALDWYMGLAVNNPTRAPTTVTEVKRKLINEFQKPSSEDQFMNEMIEIK